MNLSDYAEILTKEEFETASKMTDLEEREEYVSYIVEQVEKEGREERERERAAGQDEYVDYLDSIRYA